MSTDLNGFELFAKFIASVLIGTALGVIIFAAIGAARGR